MGACRGHLVPAVGCVPAGARRHGGRGGGAGSAGGSCRRKAGGRSGKTHETQKGKVAGAGGTRRVARWTAAAAAACPRS